MVETIAKISRPILKDIFPRERLFALIDNLQQPSVIWISGPAGCGKTTLISSYLDACKMPCLWYQIDQGDADIATFFYYLGLAAKKAAPRKRKALPLLTPEYALGIPTFTKSFFESLFERLPKPYGLVFDNYQDMETDSALHNVMRDGLSVIPEQITIFFLSRAEPPACFSRARANRSMEIVGWNTLRLVPQETQGLVRTLSRRTFTDKAIDLLHSKAQGWIAGLLLLLKRAEMEDMDPLQFEQFTPEEVFDYFASEIFEKTKPGIQYFLMRTAVFSSMTSRMAEQITGFDQAQSILVELNQSHFFTSRRVGQQTTYAYHPLFREFLLARAKKNFQSAEWRQLQRSAAEMLALDDQVEEAFQLFREAEDSTGMTRLILEQAENLLYQGRNKTLEDWLKALPAHILEKEPWLLYWYGTCLISLNPTESRERFKEALDVFEKQDDRKGVITSLCGIFDSILYGFSSFQVIDEWIPGLNKVFNEYRDLLTLDLEVKITLSMLQALFLRQPYHRDIPVWEKRALGYIQEESKIKTDARIALVIMVMYYYLNIGRLAEARLLLDTYRDLSRSESVLPLTRILFEDTKAWVYCLQAEFEACFRVVSAALKTASSSGIHLVDPFLNGFGAAAALSLKDLALADKYLQDLESHSTRLGPYCMGLYYCLVAWKALLMNEPIRALHYSELSMTASAQGGAVVTDLICLRGHALVLHCAGRDKEADAMLERVLTLARHNKAIIIECGSYLVQAEFNLDRQDEPAALSALQKGLALAKELDYMNDYYWRPRAMARLCCKALEAGIEVEYVQKLIRRRNLVLDEAPVHLEHWPRPLKIYTLGGFRVLIHDRPLRFSRKTQEKPLAMLKTIIAFGSTGVKEEAVVDVLWPEAEGDFAHNSFKITLHRLRRLLGQEDVVQLKAGRLHLNQNLCWVDSWAFERILDQAADRFKEGRTEVHAQLLQKAFEIYKGPFLPQDQGRSVIDSVRERLKAQFERLHKALT